MQVKEYINKNLPNLNWNILPQIFEDEGIELTEEIKAYLKETPGNTNWNVLHEMSGSGEDKSTKIHIVLTKQSRYDENYDEVWTWFTGSVQLDEPLTSTGQCTISYQKGENNLTISADEFLIFNSAEIDGVYISLEQDRKTITCSSDETNNPEPNNEIIIDIEIN